MKTSTPALGGLLLCLLACGGSEPPPVPSARPAPTPAPAVTTAPEPRVPPTRYRAEPPAAEPDILAARCGWCHALPDPSLLDQAGWEYLVPKMAENIITYELGPPIPEEEVQLLLRYYVTNAPAALPELELDFAPSPLEFEPLAFAPPPVDYRTLDSLPFIASVNVVDLNRDSRPDVLSCDVQSDLVTWSIPTPEGWREEVLSRAPAPARAEPVDVDLDGDLDVVVALLGSGRPTDEPVGGVVLLLNEGSLPFRPLPIAGDLPRVADVRPGDFDGDGDVDFVAAIFGGWTVGRISWLEQVEPLRFVEHVVLEKNGGIHVPVLDLDADGDLDFLALVSQHHEEIHALVNDGSGRFEPVLLWKAPHPLWGSSGITPADLDGDGDVDLVHTNGDAHDMNVAAKPYHGVQWLENLGGLRFAYHDITRLYGAYGSSVGDLDLDGDLDIVATSQLTKWPSETAEALIWLENDGRGRFTRHLVARFPHELVTSAVADLDFDGRPDILTGAMHLAPPTDVVSRTVFWRSR